MPTNDGRTQLIKYLEDIYALESHLVQVLDDHIKDAQNEPMTRQKIEQHLRETELHRDRVEQRLSTLGQGKPTFKATLSNVLGQMVGSLAGARTYTLARNARDEYASEQMEIASYIELITVAQAVGDVDTVRMAQLNLRDEVAMQQWLIEHLPEVTLRGLQQEGVQVSPMAAQGVRDIFADVGIGAFGRQQPFGQVQPPPFQQPQANQPPPVVS
jgi:ferritin-like metal-binding protein YciE